MKRYRGKKNIKSTIATALIFIGIFLVLGAVGAIEHETIPIKTGVIECIIAVLMMSAGAIISK